MNRGSKPKRTKRPRSSTPLSDLSSDDSVMGQPKAVEKRLQVAIDMGTTSTGVAYRLRGISDEIYVVQFNPGSNAQNPSLSKAIFYYRGDKLFWGEELQDMLANGTVAPGQVVRLAKLATYQNQETRNIRLTVRRQLKAVGKDLEKLFTDYYTSLVHRAIDAACARGVARHEIQQLPLDIFSCSPDGVDPGSNVPQVVAAQNMGADASYVTSEPVCFATALHDHQKTHWKSSEWTLWKDVGDVAVVVDAGGGLGCITVAECQTTPDSSANNFAMKTILPTMKAICGSMLVNEGFKAFLDTCDKIEREGGIERLALSLDYEDVDHFKDAASEAFEESCKWDFPLKKRYNLMVDSLAPERDAWTLSMTAAEVETFYKPVVDNLLQTTRSVVQQIPNRRKLKVIVLGGGFSRNKYLRQRFESEWEQEGVSIQYRGADIDCVNPRGALLRNQNPHMLGLQHRFNLAVLRDEPWDPERHPDTVSWTRVVRGEPTYGKNRNVVERGHYDRSEDYSVQRLHFIYRDGKEVQESWSKHFPEQGTEFRLLQKLIITDRNDLPDGSPYLQQDGENCHPYLRHFRTVSRKFEKPGEQGWQLVEHADHTATYAVAVCTKVFVSDDRIRVGMKVADIADCPEDEEEEDRRGQAKIEWLDDGDLAEVWSAKFSQVPLSAEA